MTYRIDADHSRTYLLPPAVEDWVAKDHPIRFVRTFVDEYLVGEHVFDGEEEPAKGRPAYAPELLLKIWLAAYMSRHRSCRKVEELCRDYLPMVWLTTGECPDHHTLWRFWHRHRALIGRLFDASVRIAAHLGMVDMALHAIDGTKIGAASSTHRVVGEEQLEAKLARLDERIRQIEGEIEQARATDGDQPLEVLSEELQDRQRLRERVKEELQIVAAAGTRINPREPEARLMKKVGLGYNAQNVVDAKCSIVVAQTVVADANDEHQLVPMLDQVKETFGVVASETLADGGYNTLAAVAEAEAKNYPILLSASANDPENHQDDPFHITQFRYDEPSDQWSCPQGQILTRRSKRFDKRRNTTVTLYRSKACRTCPVRDQCTRDRRGRSIELRDGLLPMIRQRQKRAIETNRELLKRRMPIAERVFAVEKSILEFRRFRMCGLSGARLEWRFVSAVHNIRVILGVLFPTNRPA
ncbi:MAG: IS1182 family transposase [Thermoanaerobaculia bacterium]